MLRNTRTLREALARKYPLESQARVFVKDVPLDPIRIELKGRADHIWFSILDEAEKQGERCLHAVLKRALDDYPNDEALRRLLDGSSVRYAEGPDIRTLHWQGHGDQTLEKIWGKQSALVPVSFLELGVRCARAVARIRVADGSLGTGFLVEEDLLVTNHHVLRDREAAASAILHFNHQKTADGRDAEVEEGRLDPGSFFATSTEDDCTIVKVHGNPTARWGAIALRSAQIKRDDRVNIIQHPGGDQKQLSFFHNLVEYVGAGRVQYLTDTLPGSSGSPVFDKDWQLVALHHSGGWITEPGSRDRFFRNEGIYVDRILDLLRRSR